MKNFLIFIMVLGLLYCTDFSVTNFGANKESKQVIQKLTQSVKNKEIAALAKLVAYPLKREFPLPDINNQHEFTSRYYEIFDPLLTALIERSKISDWIIDSTSAYLKDALSLNDGKITAIHYQSAKEKQIRDYLIEKEKKTLHQSICNYRRPILLCETPKFRIRIDELLHGELRYASWSGNKDMSKSPDLVLGNGKFIPIDSLGICKYQFSKSKHKYIFEINTGSKQNSSKIPARFVVKKHGKIILKEPLMSNSKWINDPLLF